MLTAAACRHLDLLEENTSISIADLSHPLELIEKLGMACKGVIHVGANIGQEFQAYRKAGLRSAIYIEPVPELFAILEKRVSIEPRHIAVQALCSDRDDDAVEFNIASNGGQSSSMLALGRHAREYPDVSYTARLMLKTTTLDRIIFGTPPITPGELDCLVLDVQGAEAKVIAGADRTLSQCRFVFSEISTGGLYVGDAQVEVVTDALKSHGFTMYAMQLNRHGWGNAFYVKPEDHINLARAETPRF